MVKKVKRVQSLNKENEMILVEFEGELLYLEMDQIESHLTSYFTIREKLREEKRLRKAHQHLQEKWEEYQFALRLVKDYKDGIDT